MSEFHRALRMHPPGILFPEPAKRTAPAVTRAELGDEARPSTQATAVASASEADLRALGAAIAQALYPDPQPYLTAEAFARAHHDDLAGLSDEQLVNERLLALGRRAAERGANPQRDDVPRSEWLRARILRLETESARRRAARAPGMGQRRG